MKDGPKVVTGGAALGTGRVIWLLALAVISVGLILIAVWYFGGDEREAGMTMPASSVVVEPASPYLFADIIEAIGTAKANESVVLTAQVSDTVKSIHFTDGGKVEKGAIIVTLTNAEELANVSAAMASYTEARQQFDRVKPLVDQGTLSAAAMDAATRTLNEAKARLDAVRARAGDYVISAPFGGYLGLREVSPGTLVSPGTQITTLDDISLIKVDFSVPEKFISALKVGQEIAAGAAAYPGREFRGIVRTIGTRVDPVTRAVTIRAEIPNPDDALRPGMLLTVDLVSNLSQGISVPENALIPVGEDQFLFRATAANTAERIKVVVGRRYSARVEVKSGLAEGDLVITSGMMRLRDGSPITIQRQAEPPALPEFLLSFKREQAGEDGE